MNQSFETPPIQETEPENILLKDVLIIREMIEGLTEEEKKKFEEFLAKREAPECWKEKDIELAKELRESISKKESGDTAENLQALDRMIEAAEKYRQKNNQQQENRQEKGEMNVPAAEYLPVLEKNIKEGNEEDLKRLLIETLKEYDSKNGGLSSMKNVLSKGKTVTLSYSYLKGEEEEKEYFAKRVAELDPKNNIGPDKLASLKQEVKERVEKLDLTIDKETFERLTGEEISTEETEVPENDITEGKEKIEKEVAEKTAELEEFLVDQENKSLKDFLDMAKEIDEFLEKEEEEAERASISLEDIKQRREKLKNFAQTVFSHTYNEEDVTEIEKFINEHKDSPKSQEEISKEKKAVKDEINFLLEFEKKFNIELEKNSYYKKVKEYLDVLETEEENTGEDNEKEQSEGTEAPAVTETPQNAERIEAPQTVGEMVELMRTLRDAQKKLSELQARKLEELQSGIADGTATQEDISKLEKRLESIQRGISFAAGNRVMLPAMERFEKVAKPENLNENTEKNMLLLSMTILNGAKTALPGQITNIMQLPQGHRTAAERIVVSTAPSSRIARTIEEIATTARESDPVRPLESNERAVSGIDIRVLRDNHKPGDESLLKTLLKITEKEYYLNEIRMSNATEKSNYQIEFPYTYRDGNGEEGTDKEKIKYTIEWQASDADGKVITKKLVIDVDFQGAERSGYIMGLFKRSKEDRIIKVASSESIVTGEQGAGERVTDARGPQAQDNEAVARTASQNTNSGASSQNQAPAGGTNTTTQTGEDSSRIVIPASENNDGRNNEATENRRKYAEVFDFIKKIKEEAGQSKLGSGIIDLLETAEKNLEKGDKEKAIKCIKFKIDAAELIKEPEQKRTEIKHLKKLLEQLGEDFMIPIEKMGNQTRKTELRKISPESLNNNPLKTEGLSIQGKNIQFEQIRQNLKTGGYGDCGPIMILNVLSLKGNGKIPYSIQELRQIAYELRKERPKEASIYNQTSEQFVQSVISKDNRINSFTTEDLVYIFEKLTGKSPKQENIMDIDTKTKEFYEGTELKESNIDIKAKIEEILNRLEKTSYKTLVIGSGAHAKALLSFGDEEYAFIDPLKNTEKIGSKKEAKKRILEELSGESNLLYIIGE